MHSSGLIRGFNSSSETAEQRRMQDDDGGDDELLQEYVSLRRWNDWKYLHQTPKH